MTGPSSQPRFPLIHVLLWVAVLLMAGFILFDRVLRSRARVAIREPEPRGDLDPDEWATSELFRRVSPSVVHIRMLRARRRSGVVEVPRGAGTGVIWDASGIVVTNFHVVEEVVGGGLLIVTFADGSSHRATVVGAAPDRDLAVLRIASPPGGLVEIPVGSSEELRVGQKVYAIGNPFGLDQTLTAGIVSALGRQIGGVTGRPITDVIQTDAAIYPGNSGGPLLDSAGRMVGMNTAIYSPDGAGNTRIGFAIPVDTEFRRIIARLEEEGALVRAGLGVYLAHDSVSERHQLPGLRVLQVVPESAAARAGLRPTREHETTGEIIWGDVIVAIDGTPTRTRKEFDKQLGGRRVGETVTLTVSRDGKRVEVPVTLQAL